MKVWGEMTRDGALMPYKRWLQELAEAGFRPGVRLQITIDKDRNGKFNALAHLCLGLVAKAINRGPATTDIDQLKNWIKLQRGYFDVVPLPTPKDGVTHVIQYHSTSYAGMAEGEFHAFMTDACDLIREKLAPWIADAPEWAEARSIIDSIVPEGANAA